MNKILLIGSICLLTTTFSCNRDQSNSGNKKQQQQEDYPSRYDEEEDFDVRTPIDDRPDLEESMKD